MSQFILLLYDDPSGWQKLSPEEMQKAIEKYMAWTSKSVLSQRLDDHPGRVIRSTSGKPVATDGPFSESKEVLGGFYTIEATDFDDAVKIAMTHPHLEHNGRIDIRKIYED